MSSSSSSSPFVTSKNSAFSPCNQYTNKSICIVPREWKEYSKTNMDAVLQSKLTSHWSDYKKVEGAVVKIGDVAAKLEYHDNRIWMKRYGDQRSKPHPQEYVLTHVQKYGLQKK